MRTSPGTTGPFVDTPLKWVGVVTVLLSLLLLVNQASKVFAEIQDRQRQVGELQAAADRQQREGDFAEAWASLERAATTAGQGSYLARLASPPEPGRQAVRTAQEDLAMAWLERASASGGAQFSDTVDPLLPALAAGVDAATGRRKGDLLAHVGWAHFLKSRDGGEAVDPEPFYRQAIELDQTNPYAHAHWGHWLAWPGFMWIAIMFYLLVFLVVLEIPRALARLAIGRVRRVRVPGDDAVPVGAPADTTPAMSAVPVSGVTSVASMRRSVVLPAPLGPRSPVISPSGAMNETSLTAWTSRFLPKDLASASTRIMATP